MNKETVNALLDLRVELICHFDKNAFIKTKDIKRFVENSYQNLLDNHSKFDKALSDTLEFLNDFLVLKEQMGNDTH